MSENIGEVVRVAREDIVKNPEWQLREAECIPCEALSECLQIRRIYATDHACRYQGHSLPN